MQQKFLKNLLFLLFLNLLIKPLWIFGIDRTVQNIVGTEEYGIYYALFNVGFLINILLDMGLSNYSNRQFAHNPILVKKLFPKLLSLRILLAALYLIILMIFGFLLEYKTAELTLLFYIGLIHVFLSMVVFLRSILGGNLHFKEQSIVSVLDRTLLIIICGTIIWLHIIPIEMSIELFIKLQVVTLLITNVIAAILILKKLKILKIEFNYKYSLLLIKKGFPFALLAVIMSIYYRVDGIMLERMLEDGAYQAGVYAQSFRILDATNILGYLFASLLLPSFSRLLSQKKDIKPLLKLSQNLLLVPSILIAMSCFFYSDFIIESLYHDVAETSSTVFFILILGFVPIASFYIFSTVLTAQGKMKELNIIALLSMVLNLLLNFIIIPKYAAVGAAVASLISHSLASILQYLIVVKNFKLSIINTYSAKIIAFVILLIGFHYLISFSGLIELWNFILLMIFGIVLLWLLKFVNPSKIIQILSVNDANLS